MKHSTDKTGIHQIKIYANQPMHNISKVDDALAARTDPDCAWQRVANLAALGAKSVLGLRIGPPSPL